MTSRVPGAALMVAAAGVTAGIAALPAGFRVRRIRQPLGELWRELPVEPPGSTRLGISFRPLQARDQGLEPRAALARLLAEPFDVVRLAAYWDRLEPGPGRFEPEELDWQLEAVEAAGRQAIVVLGAVKSFGYPETFVPAHLLGRPLPEGRLVTPASHRALLDAAVAFVSRLVERYRDRPSVVAWQVENEAVDPLGFEHSWRLAESFVEAEVAAVRLLDPGRPIVLTGFLAPGPAAALPQWWRTRGQGDSLAIAERHADVVGLDSYPRIALLKAGSLGVYADGSRSAWAGRRNRRLVARVAARGGRVMVTEGQAEPWETTLVPPSPPAAGMASCLPEHVIETYNAAMRWAGRPGPGLDAYLFWGAEYWLRRELDGDPRYLGAVRRILAAR